MSSNSSWVPNEDSQTLFSERCWLQGAFVCTFAYGIILSLFIMSFNLLVRPNNRLERKKRSQLLIYITLTFILCTIFTVANTAFAQMAFIDNRNYPGGPSAYENNMFSVPIDDAGSAAMVLSNWLSDALVVWRFKVIYQLCPLPIWMVMFFPCLALTGSIVLGILFFIQLSTTNPYQTSNSINYTLPYLGLSLALNIVLTVLIVIRLLNYRYKIVSVMGPAYGTHYTSLAAIFIESAALYSAVSIAFLVLFGIGNVVSQAFLQSLTQFQAVATLLIVFRVAQGKAWTEKTGANMVSTSNGSETLALGNMQFAPPNNFRRLETSGDTLT